jgi:hypothetical protein
MLRASEHYLLGNASGEHVAAMLILAMLMIDSVHWGGIGYAGKGKQRVC